MAFRGFCIWTLHINKYKNKIILHSAPTYYETQTFILDAINRIQVCFIINHAFTDEITPHKYYEKTFWLKLYYSWQFAHVIGLFKWAT